MDLITLLHLDVIFDFLQYNDAFDKGAKVIKDFSRGLNKIGVAGAGLAFIIGGLFWIFGGDDGKRTAKQWWIGAAVGLCVVLSATTIVGWFQANGKF